MMMLLMLMMMAYLDINIVETRKDNITGMHGSRPTDRSANINVITIMITITIVTKYDKVNRCLARYSLRATTTNRPTNRAPKKPAWPGPN